MKASRAAIKNLKTIEELVDAVQEMNKRLVKFERILLTLTSETKSKRGRAAAKTQEE